MARRSSNGDPQTLEQFMRAKQRKACKVCALAPEIQAQLGKPASDRGFSRADQVEWLNGAVNAEITRRELDDHINRRHAEAT